MNETVKKILEKDAKDLSDRIEKKKDSISLKEAHLEDERNRLIKMAQDLLDIESFLWAEDDDEDEF